ncbi:UNVERIFIED_CONTAM: hypothetical protein PYX00_009270 [Menopon gallinae]|uniref:STAS domain-containing protein n=1 Tax=Menopon gallinae TaxID=328185 RepID=A0AAW2HAU3_9NEOP
MDQKDYPQTVQAFRLAYEYHSGPKVNLLKKFKESITPTKETPFNLFPIARWIRKYKVKKYLLDDVIAGITVAVMHIPHGLAYSQLGSVPPVVGLYMAVFPLIPYVICGTSKHISLGTFAVVCAMAGEIVYTTKSPDKSTEESIQIAAAAALVVGLWQILIYIFRLGSLTIFLSNSLVSGFTTGAAFHVLTYQFKDIFGIHVERLTGPLKLVRYYFQIFRKLKDTNLVTLAMSASFFTLLIVFYYVIKPTMKKKCPKCPVTIPMELIAISIGIMLSYFLKLNEKYGVQIVAHVPKGLPTPKLPDVSVFTKLIIPCFPIAVVAVSINLSLAKIFAKKDGSTIESKQEILAYGVMNICGSFFQCLPVAASLSRSALQYGTGGKTQLATVFSMILIILILLFMGPLFEPVPYCVLSSIVVASILSMIFHIRELPKIFKRSTLDGLVWLSTFLGVVFIDIDYGLLIGFIASIMTLVYMHHCPQFIELGRAHNRKENRDFFLDMIHFKAADDIPNLYIVKLIGCLNFANISHVENKIVKAAKNLELNDQVGYGAAVILDFSSVSYVDPSACDGFGQIWQTLSEMNVRLFMSSFNVKVFTQLEHNQVFCSLPPNRVFQSVQDAVTYATKFDVIETDPTPSK